MKKYFYCPIFLAFFIVSHAQHFDAPVSLFRTNDGISNTKPSVSQIYNNYNELMSHPDTSLNHDKKMADRWMRYTFSKFNILDEYNYSNESYTSAIESIYTSPLNCAVVDPADWISDGPVSIPTGQTGGMVTAIYNDPNHLNSCLIGTLRGGIFSTTDGGINWTCVTDLLPFPVLGVKQIIASPENPDYLLAITGTENIKGGVIYSSDGGVTWNKVTQNLPQFYWIDFHPSISGLAFAATKDDVKYTLNYGLTWSSLGVPNSYESVYRNFQKIVVFENNFFVSNFKEYYVDYHIYSASFSLNSNSVSISWGNELSQSFISSNFLRFCDFSNKIGEKIYLEVIDENNDIKIYKTNDSGSNFTLLNFTPSQSKLIEGNANKNVLIASPNDENVLYLACVYNIRKYNVITGSYVSIDGIGDHDDYRCYQIIKNGNLDRILTGNDGGAAMIENGLAQSPNISSINGNLSISLLHSFDVHEKTSRIAYAFQDHAMRYRDKNLSFSGTFIWEGKMAMIQEDYLDAIVGEDTYYGIYDKPDSPHPIVDGILGLPFGNIKSCSIKYRHYPERFAAGFGNTELYPYGKVAMNRAANVSEFSHITTSQSIGEVAICERKPQYIYAGEYESGQQDYRLFKSTDDGYEWTPMNPLVYSNGTPISLSLVLDYKRINAIAVDHIDENIVYIGISGTYEENEQIVDEKFRVIKSTDGGNSFNDYSQGLPALPIEKLLTVESDNQLVFCATSVGIYYRTNEMTRWECFSKNLPKVEITEMEYNYCDNTLYVSTYGRGVWKSIVNLNTDNSFKEEISTTTTWNTSRHLKNHLVIKNDAVLTITSTIFVGKDRKIIIEPGAKLIIDGGTITSECGSFWEGIEIWGNSAQTQTQGHQGTLIMKNGAVLENAHEAVRVWKPDDWASTGGIIHATNSFFRNNWRSIEYIFYHSLTSNNNEIKNKGYIADCEFTWDDNFFRSDAACGISLFHVNGVRIYRSKFIDNRTYVATWTNRPIGIKSIDAGYSVIGRYASPTLPQNQNQDAYFNPNLPYCEFKNLEIGIDASNASSSFPFLVDNSQFENCGYGVYLSSHWDATVIRNKFEANNNKPSAMPYMKQLNFNWCSGYKVEGNVFNNSTFGALGCLVYNSQHEPNQIYR
ncbi:MAG: hypothetical protein HYU67_11780, partial [Flavobacteriia bacterium]|nr:hypothetical protein [Flavobacteriia bacterium]